MKLKTPWKQERARIASFAWLPAAAICTSCASEPFVWYEEAQQDNGSIVIVKTSETRSSQTGLAPGANMTGYRFIQIEFDNPVTGQHMRWKPSGIPPLNPLALHFDRETAFIFGYPYTYALGQYGCPIPPYVIFKSKGRTWTRVLPSEVTQRFSRVNLLTSSGEDFFQDGKSMYVQEKKLIRAPSLDKSRQKPINFTDRYTFRLQYENVGPLEGDCGRVPSFATSYDYLELTNDLD